MASLKYRLKAEQSSIRVWIVERQAKNINWNFNLNILTDDLESVWFEADKNDKVG